ncbi:MAG: DNA mismatch repair endonuclease MutL [Candidatus Thermoplasmatota archaeon]|nr:DNA mismatch repair endonuclease MutL [Candidatus Thermoplasmatota archaeon]
MAVAGRIRVLDGATVDKIAAGEVVERPSSVVKELVENSFDAGASSISVMVEDGGRAAVTVRDDGCGMSREDAQAAFLRHATSKIASLEDLSRLVTYGFRGEALSSIASVSRVTLRTREHGAAEGTEVVVEGGSPVSVSTVGVPNGTEISVRDLFYNVPARRKSMKGKKVEAAHCREVMVAYAIARAGLSFTFASDGETQMVHVPAEGMRGSLVAAFGAKAAENMLWGESSGDGIRVEAYLGRLEHTKSSPSDLRLFVNGRPVRGPRLLSAVVEAYGSRLMKDRYPIGVLRILVEPDEIDVNVHPSKREVRFGDESRVLDAVRACVGKALEEPDLTFQYDLTKFSESFEASPASLSPEVHSQVQRALAIEEPPSQGTAHPVIIPLAQIMSTYILAESAGNLLLIDQHAASERIVYERVLKSIQCGKEVSQTLLTPLVLHLTASEQRAVEENIDTLKQSGFEIEMFGKDAFALRSIPTVLGAAQGESAFRNILGDLSRSAPEKRVGLAGIWLVACHSAVRAGESLSEGQMRTLISELLATDNPYTCEHGRPTMISLSSADLEKLFKRRV